MICPTCGKRVLPHASKIVCHVCTETYHMKCISLSTADHDCMRRNLHNWICLQCISSIFPFNHIEDNNEFIDMSSTTHNNELIMSDLIYNPFDLNAEELDNYFKYDPDANFYSEQNLFNGYSCHYYMEESFNERVRLFTNKSSQCFSVFHVNLRSVNANLSHLEHYLQLLNFKFPVIGITETWLNDNTCDLFSLPTYSFIERHRQSKSGGGVGLFIKDGIKYQERLDLGIFTEACESLFIEIDKSEFNSGKNIIIGVTYRPHCKKSHGNI